MATQVQFRGGTTTAHGSFTGAAREVTVDTDKDTVVIHDGSTAGGFPLLREDGSNSALSLGTAGTPSLKFTGDANTGIYSPGADQVAISTNGTGRLFVNSSGNVGINTNAPTDHGGYGGTLEITGSPGGALYLKSSTDVGQLGMNSSGLQLRTRSAKDILFSTNNSERLRITSDGKLGLGTSTPWSTFTVGSGGTANPAATATIHQNTHSEYRLKLTSSAYNADGNWLGLGFGYSNSYLKAGIIAQAKDVYARTNLHFCLDGTASSANADLSDSKMVITYEGNVGIGTTSPQDTIDCLGRIRVTQSGGNPRFGSIEATSDVFQLKAFGGVSGQTADMAFYTGNDTPTEKARIDSSGRLLVGTSTALTNDYWTQGQLQLASNNGAVIQAYTFTNSSSNGSAIELHRARGTQDSPSNPSIDDLLGEINFYGYNSSAGTPFQRAAVIRAFVDGTPASSGDTTDMPGRLVFSTTADGASSPTERMRIDSLGKSAFSCAATATGVQVSHAGGSGNSRKLFLGRHSTSTESFIVWTNGDVQNTNNSYTGISDIKLKENIVDASSQWDDLKAIQVRNYNFKEETGHQTHTQLGVIAQEIELVSPGLVSESPDRDEDDNDLGTTTKSVNYSVLYMKAVKALQEAMERIETLEQRLNDAGIA